jgi:hypothetical protein
MWWISRFHCLIGSFPIGNPERFLRLMAGLLAFVAPFRHDRPISTLSGLRITKFLVVWSP